MNENKVEYDVDSLIRILNKQDKAFITLSELIELTKKADTFEKLSKRSE